MVQVSRMNPEYEMCEVINLELDASPDINRPLEGALRGGGHRVGQLHSRFSREAVIFAISIGIRFRELQ